MGEIILTFIFAGCWSIIVFIFGLSMGARMIKGNENLVVIPRVDITKKKAAKGDEI